MRVEIVGKGQIVHVLADDKLITISVLDDGTVNISTPDGCITKIWPTKEANDG